MPFTSAINPKTIVQESRFLITNLAKITVHYSKYEHDCIGKFIEFFLEF